MGAENDKLLNEFKGRFKNMSDEHLIDAFNSQVGNPGLVNAKVLFITALQEEFKKRKFDYSLVGYDPNLSFKNRIKLAGKKILFDTI